MQNVCVLGIHSYGQQRSDRGESADSHPAHVSSFRWTDGSAIAQVLRQGCRLFYQTAQGRQESSHGSLARRMQEGNYVVLHQSDYFILTFDGGFFFSNRS